MNIADIKDKDLKWLLEAQRVIEEQIIAKKDRAQRESLAKIKAIAKASGLDVRELQRMLRDDQKQANGSVSATANGKGGDAMTQYNGQPVELPSEVDENGIPILSAPGNLHQARKTTAESPHEMIAMHPQHPDIGWTGLGRHPIWIKEWAAMGRDISELAP